MILNQPPTVDEMAITLRNAGWTYDRDGWHAPHCSASYPTVRAAYLAWRFGRRCEQPLVNRDEKK